MKGLASTGGDNAWTSSVLPVNTWTHVAITYSLSDGEIRHYINGEPDATHKFNSNAKIRFDRALRLGVQWNNHNKLNGQLDDLLIYADALTPLEIRQIFEGTRPGVPGDYQFKISGNRLLTNGFFDYEQRDEVLLRVKTRDRAGLELVQDLLVPVGDSNDAPTGVTLSESAINENEAKGTEIGELEAVDPDGTDTFTFELVDGIGSSGNSQFTIEEGVLKTAAKFDFETSSSYNIRVRATDSGGLTAESPLTVYVHDLNEAPTGLSLSNDDIIELQSAGAFVGVVQVADPDTGFSEGSLQYEVISKSLTWTQAKADAESKGGHLATITSQEEWDSLRQNYGTSLGGCWIGLTDEAKEGQWRWVTGEPYEFRKWSAGQPSNNSGAGDYVRIWQNGSSWDDVTIASKMPKYLLEYSYTIELVQGVDDFELNGFQLVSKRPLQVDTGATRSIRIKVTDFGGLSYEKNFTVKILDEPDPPHDIHLDNSTVEEDQAVGTLVGRFTADDADLGDSHTYRLVSGSGATHNELFRVEDNRLLTHDLLDHELNASLSIRVRAMDRTHLDREEVFLISVTDRVEPQLPLLSAVRKPMAGGVVNGIGYHQQGSDVSVEAVAAPGYQFAGWGGDASGVAAQTTVHLDGNKSVTAHFVPSAYSVRVAADPDDRGYIITGAGTYFHGEEAILTVSPSDEWDFYGWGRCFRQGEPSASYYHW